MRKKEEGLPKISLVVITDGRNGYLERTLESFNEKVKYDFYESIVIDDIAGKFPKIYLGFDKVIHHKTKQGFAGAYHSAFNAVPPESDYCFILEDDFIFNDKIYLSDMIDILVNNPKLCQVALKRQAWNKEELKAGGIVECDPDSFEDQTFWDLKWCEHRKFFTTNPSLAPMWVIKKGWPLCERSEGIFTHELFKDPEVKSAYLGHKFDPPKVHHIGEVRNGINY